MFPYLKDIATHLDVVLLCAMILETVKEMYGFVVVDNLQNLDNIVDFVPVKLFWMLIYNVVLHFVSHPVAEVQFKYITITPKIVGFLSDWTLRNYLY